MFTVPNLNFTVKKRSLILTLSRGSVDVSGLGGIWVAPSHGGNVCCGHAKSALQTFFWGRSVLYAPKDQKDHPDYYQKPKPRFCAGIVLY